MFQNMTRVDMLYEIYSVSLVSLESPAWLSLALSTSSKAGPRLGFHVSDVSEPAKILSVHHVNQAQNDTYLQHSVIPRKQAANNVICWLL